MKWRCFALLSFIPTHIPEIPYFFTLNFFPKSLNLFPKSKSLNLSPTICYITVVDCPLCCIAIDTLLPQPINLILKDKIFVYDLVNQRIGWTNYDCEIPSVIEKLTSL